MISSITSLEIISVLCKAKSEWRVPSETLAMRPDPNIFLWIAVSVDGAAAVNPNRIKIRLGNDLSTFPIKGIPVFSNGPKSVLKNPPDYPILCNSVFDKFILAAELLVKVLWSLETCVLVNNTLRGKLVSSFESPITFERYKRNFQSYFSVIFYSRF